MALNSTSLKSFLKRIYFGFNPSDRIIVLDYPVKAKPLYSFNKPHKQLFEQIAKSDNEFHRLLQSSLKYKTNLQQIKDSSVETNETEPTWNNNYVPALDIIMLYTILKEFTPRQYIEIGSGTTTKTANKARKENNLAFSITCIDPFPRQPIKEIAEKWIDKNIQDVSLDIFQNLSKNDIVFFDGTHTVLPNSDSTWFFLEILPVLPKGVIIEVHDIYLPYDYPQFMCDRYYSENYVLGAVLLANPEKYEIICPNFYISEQKHLAKTIEEYWQHSALQNLEKHGGSFWFRVV